MWKVQGLSIPWVLQILTRTVSRTFLPVNRKTPTRCGGALKPMKPKGLKERGVIWYSDGKKTPDFSIYVIHVDNPGWHDAQLEDVDRDGDIDIVSKVWNADGPFYHMDYWRNELKK